MIRQISMDIEIPDEEYDKLDNEAFAIAIERDLDLPVLGIQTTASWKTEEDYEKNFQIGDK